LRRAPLGRRLVSRDLPLRRRHHGERRPELHLRPHPRPRRVRHRQQGRRAQQHPSLHHRHLHLPQNHSSAIANINGDFSGNYIDSCRGVHQNAITVYGGSTAPATTWKVHDNIVRNFRQRHGNFGFSAQLHRDFLVYNNVFEADGGYAGDDLAIGSNYFRFYNNTVLGPVRIDGLANNALADFRNNIGAWTRRRRRRELEPGRLDENHPHEQRLHAAVLHAEQRHGLDPRQQ
jgi:hypothetical protein